MITSTVATAKLLPRTGPRPLVSAGMATAAGLVVFAQLGLSWTYGALVVPGLIVAGAGLDSGWFSGRPWT